jgi:hypothetical protein
MLEKNPSPVSNAETKKYKRYIISAYNEIYFDSEAMPEKIGDLRELLKEKYEQKFGVKISSKKLDEFAYVWHPKYNFRKDRDVKNPKYFQSYGCLSGNYYPSDDSLDEGTLVTSRGVLPAVLTREFRKQLTKSEAIKNSERRVFYCWLHGQSEPPFYNCLLVRPMKFLPHWSVKESGFFKVRGIVERLESEKTFIKIQRNHSQNPESTAFELLVLDCPEEIQVGEFWSIEAMFEEGFLRCKQAKQIK